MKKIFLALIVLLMSFVLVSATQAATLTAGPLAISYDGDGAIFSEMNIAPGSEYVKALSITNNGAVAHSFALATKNVSGDLADHIYIEPEVDGSIAWSLTVYDLSNLPEESQTVIASINPGETKNLNLKARFDSSETSAVAGQTVSFDFIFGTEEAEPASAGATGLTLAGLIGSVFSTTPASPTAPPTTTPTASVTASPTGEGEVLGAKDDEGVNGLNGLLLLIPALALVLSVPFVTPGMRNAVLPTIGAGATVVLSFFTKGSFTPAVFWSILIAEIIAILVVDYFIVKKTIVEVLEEEEVLERKARRARRKRK